jgi:hypothetical protein
LARSPSASSCWPPALPPISRRAAGSSATSGPAGRASCAEGGHFVACIPVLQRRAAVVLPLVGIVDVPTNGRLTAVHCSPTS